MTEPLTEKLQHLRTEAKHALDKAADQDSLEPWRVKYLGRKGQLARLIKDISQLDAPARKSAGQLANTIKQELTQAFTARAAVFRDHHSAPATALSGASLPPASSVGHLHPITLSIRRIQHIFARMGFIVAEGPLVEDPAYNFDLLNIPLHHPARAETDTFHTASGSVLRTHTSPVQLRAVLAMNLTPPFSVISPGRVFRSESTDASHEHTFHQLEAFMVGERVTVADFKGVVKKYFSDFFEQNVTTRLRPSYFPFVEPGFEVDMSCIICQQAGCSVCGRTGWLEMMGAGMVHPNVLKNMNIDHTRWQGFAFGGGIDRLAMLRHHIDDVRLFMSGRLDFLNQFS